METVAWPCCGGLFWREIVVGAMSSESESDVDYLPVPKAAASRNATDRHTPSASRTVTDNTSRDVSKSMIMFAVREAKSVKKRAEMKRSFGKSLNSAVSLISRKALGKGNASTS